jgi:hypothetical protein
MPKFCVFKGKEDKKRSFMKTLSLLTLLFSFAMPNAFADHHEEKEKCICTKECKEKCKKGDKKDCQCKECESKESDHCKK